jgi:hypothetical protein
MSLLRGMRTLLASVAVLALTAAPALAQTLGQGSAPAISWWRIAAALVLCLLLAVAAAVALHLRMSGRLPSLKGAKLTLPALGGTPLGKLFNAPTDRRLKSIETIRVSPYADVCLFTCDGRTYLVAATPQGVTVIERTGPAPGEDAPS